MEKQGEPSANPALPIEQGVLGCLLLGDPLHEKLREEIFSDERHKVIFETIGLLRAEKVPDDLILIETGNRLRTRGMLDSIGGVTYLSTLIDAAPNRHNLGYWLPQLIEVYGRRALKENLRDFIVGLDDPNSSVEMSIETARKTLDYLAHSRNGHSDELSIRSPQEILDMTFDDSDCILGDRLMAKGQNSTVCGPSSVGKSRLILQQAVAVITGRQFVGLDTHGTGLKWLFIQAENSNRRYHFDLQHLKRWAGERDWALVKDCLRLHTLEKDTDSFLQLDSHVHQTKIGRLINNWQPDIVVFDCLWNFQIGDLNKDVDMAATLTAISRLCKDGNPNRIPNVLHHALTGRAGAAKATGYDRASFGRNSKVLHAWTRGQINVSAGRPTDNDTLVISCGKCSNGREFPTFAIHIDPNSRIYEPDPNFDIKSWESDMSGTTTTQPLMDSDRVRELCLVSGSSKADLAKSIMDDSGCYRGSAYRYILKAVATNKISLSSKANLFFRK